MRVWQLRQKSEAVAVISTVVRTRVNPKEQRFVMHSGAELSILTFNYILFVYPFITGT